MKLSAFLDPHSSIYKMYIGVQPASLGLFLTWALLRPWYPAEYRCVGGGVGRWAALTLGVEYISLLSHGKLLFCYVLFLIWDGPKAKGSSGYHNTTTLHKFAWMGFSVHRPVSGVRLKFGYAPLGLACGFAIPAAGWERPFVPPRACLFISSDFFSMALFFRLTILLLSLSPMWSVFAPSRVWTPAIRSQIKS